MGLNFESGEFYGDYHLLPHFYCVLLLDTVGIVARVVWRADNACGKVSVKMNSRKGTFLTSISPPLTLTATAFCRATLVHLPESSPSGGVRGTGEDFTLAATAVVLVVAVLRSSRGNTEMARCWMVKRAF